MQERGISIVRGVESNFCSIEEQAKEDVREARSFEETGRVWLAYGDGATFRNPQRSPES